MSDDDSSREGKRVMNPIPKDSKTVNDSMILFHFIVLNLRFAPLNLSQK